MIWLFLGWLLFGSGFTDTNSPQSRAAVMGEHLDSVIEDAERLARAREILDRMTREAATITPPLEAFADRLRELDADPNFREADYAGALDHVLQQIDASERRLLEGRIELRTVMTAEEWVALMAHVKELVSNA